MLPDSPWVVLWIKNSVSKTMGATLLEADPKLFIRYEQAVMRMGGEGTMYENIADLLKQIALGEDSVLELKSVEFSGNKVAGPPKDGMADEDSRHYTK